MAEKRKRSQNFTVYEKDKLVKLVYAFKNIIYKKTDGTTNQAKNEAWLYLCTQYNLMRRGGPSIVKTEPILDQVCDLMGRGCSGIAVDSDSVITIQIPQMNTNELTSEESQAIILDAEPITNMAMNEEVMEDECEVTPSCSKIPTPIWKRRRPILKEQNHPLNQIKGGNFNLKNLFGVPKND